MSFVRWYVEYYIAGRFILQDDYMKQKEYNPAKCDSIPSYFELTCDVEYDSNN